MSGSTYLQNVTRRKPWGLLVVVLLHLLVFWGLQSGLSHNITRQMPEVVQAFLLQDTPAPKIEPEPPAPPAPLPPPLLPSQRRHRHPNPHHRPQRSWPLNPRHPPQCQRLKSPCLRPPAARRKPSRPWQAMRLQARPLT